METVVFRSAADNEASGRRKARSGSNTAGNILRFII
jgi:hypothetical protein